MIILMLSISVTSRDAISCLLSLCISQCISFSIISPDIHTQCTVALYTVGDYIGCLWQA